MPTANNRSHSNRIVPYLTGVQLLEQYNRDVNSGLSDALLLRRYGKRPWFLIDPNLPPPYSKFRIAIKDTAGRGYNFPLGETDTVHVRLPRAKPYRAVGDAHVELPEPDQVIKLKDGRSFVVREIIVDATKRTNTAILRVQWN